MRNVRVARLAARQGENTVVLFDIASWSSHARFAHQEKGSAGIDRVRNASCPRAKANDTRCDWHPLRNALTKRTTNSQGHRPDRRYRRENIGCLMTRSGRSAGRRRCIRTTIPPQHEGMCSGSQDRFTVATLRRRGPPIRSHCLPDQPSSGPRRCFCNRSNEDTTRSTVRHVSSCWSSKVLVRTVPGMSRSLLKKERAALRFHD